jgi:hypothetical protein
MMLDPQETIARMKGGTLGRHGNAPCGLDSAGLGESYRTQFGNTAELDNSELNHPSVPSLDHDDI